MQAARSRQALQERLRSAGWSRQQVLNAPNTLCVLRALSGPVVATLIVQESYGPALALTAVAGATDWLDGFLARRWNQVGVLEAAFAALRSSRGQPLCCRARCWAAI